MWCIYIICCAAPRRTGTRSLFAPLALKLGLECEVLYKDVPALVEREGLSFEEAARALRYEGLF